MKTYDEKGLMSTILKWLPTHPQRQFLMAEYSNLLTGIMHFSTQILCFYHEVHKFLLCHPTNSDIVSYFYDVAPGKIYKYWQGNYLNY